MRPLKSSDITEKFLTDRPFLILDAAAFRARSLGSILAKQAIKSGGGIALPLEIWLKIFKLSLPEPEYHLVRVWTVIFHEEHTSLSCEVDSSTLTAALADLRNSREVETIDRYLAAPDEAHDLSFLDELSTDSPRPSPSWKHFSIKVDNSDNLNQGDFFPDCLFLEISVPHIIGHLQDNICWVCQDRDGRTICPGCTRGVAQEFDAFMGCGVNLACPLCLGLDFMREDKRLLQAYYWDELPKEEEEARDLRFEQRYQELGYL